MSCTASGAAQVFVGRERELAELRASWRDACDGRGRLLLISGEAGIGKTRLCEHVAREAAHDGARIFWGRCWEGGGAPSLWPWSQIVRELVRGLDRTHVATVAGDGVQYLVKLAPELSADLADAPSAASSDSHFPLFEALASFLRRAADEAPLLLVLDDLHEADEPSLLALEFVARQLPALRILILGTYRDIEAQRSPERITLLNRIARHGRRLPLAGLSPADIAALIERAFVLSPAQSVVAALHHTTEGNPFFIDEVVRLLLATPGCSQLDQLPAAGLTIPHAVRDVVRQRLQPLSAACLQTLRIASVAGREFSVATVRAVAEVTAATLLTHLDEAQRAVLVTLPTTGNDELRFCHTLIRDTLYDDMAAAERLHLHQRVGDAMLEQYRADPDAHIAAIAHHFLLSAASGGTPRAIDFAMRAARRAEAIAAFEDAAVWYGRARALLEVEGGESQQSVELLLHLGEAQSKAWNTDSAKSTFREAARLARTCVDHGDPAGARLLARAALGLGGAGVGIPRGLVDREVIDLLAAAGGLLTATDAALKARVLSRQALELYFADAEERRRELIDQAVALARDCGDPAAFAYVLNVRLIAAWDTPRTLDRLAHADEALAAALAVGERDLEMRARVFRVMELVELGELGEWQREIERCAQVVALTRLPAHESTLATLRTMNALWLGQFAEAEAMCLAQMANADQWEDRHAQISTTLQMLGLRLLQGRAAEIEPMVRFGATQPDVSPEARAAYAAMLAALGYDDEARLVFETLAAQDFADLARGRHLAGILAWLTELACRYGNRRQQQALHNYLADFGGEFLSFASRLCFGPISYYRALLEAALGQHVEASLHFETAIDLCTQTAGRPALAAAQFAYAKFLAGGDERERDSAQISAYLDNAQRVASALGMLALLSDISTFKLRRHDTLADAKEAEEKVADMALAGGQRRGARIMHFPKRPAAVKAEARGPIAVTKPEAAAAPSASIFRFEDQMWTIAHQGTVLRLRQSKGLAYLAQLLRAAGHDTHVTDLIALERLPIADAGHEFTHMTADDLNAAGMTLSAGDTGHEMIDARARSEYKRRLDDLQEQLQEAISFNDQGRMTRLQTEIEMIHSELAKTMGLGGRQRSSGSQIERARLNVTRAIQTAIKQIRGGHPELGRILANAVHTGTFCRYSPPSDHVIRWNL